MSNEINSRLAPPASGAAHELADPRQPGDHCADHARERREWDVHESDRGKRHGAAPVVHERAADDLTGPTGVDDRQIGNRAP